MTTTDTAGATTDRSPLGLWLALLSGPLAASIQLSVGYALVKWACANGGTWALGVLAGVLLAAVLGGGALAAVHLADTGPEDAVARTWSPSSRGLLAVVALALNVFTAIFLTNVIIALSALSPCE